MATLTKLPRRTIDALRASSARVGSMTLAERKKLHSGAMRSIKQGFRDYKSRIREGVLADVVNAIAHLEDWRVVSGNKEGKFWAFNRNEKFKRWTFKSDKTFLRWLAAEISRQQAARQKAVNEHVAAATKRFEERTGVCLS